ncbi:hypothetical protein J2X36_002908 [Methylobacterium sp. BE186]|uniref:TIGR02391 family protein n=1 Tax=Methylobacterium sp. BE186 TaxID=2817715 RepID=UPI002863D955|nr:TIGR02391 family protein [Methylobacterium sp. BE186]MDR7038152.1 hypothetical protein [Methylobacterium sp. BE186]
MLAAYARALGLRSALPSSGPITGVLAEDFNNILDTVVDQIPDIDLEIRISLDHCWGDAGGRLPKMYCEAAVLRARVSQLISYLEHIHHLNSNIVEIGSLFNSIKDDDLKSRCSDLLSAPGNFDRAINQATQVLEDKLRKISKIDKDLTGPNLVNSVINSTPSKGLLRVAENDDEHEGIAHICRGIMLAFRNPTHHSLSDDYTREDALKLCAFIDNLISAIERAEPIQK